MNGHESIRRFLCSLVLALLVAGAPNAGSAAPSKRASASSGPKPTVVLVHGAFADATGWHDVILLLPPDPERGARFRTLAAGGAAQQQLRDAAAIVHRRRQRRKRDDLASVLGNLGRIGEFGLAPDNGARVDQRYEEFRDQRRPSGDILNVDLGRVHARSGARDTAAIRPGLSAAYDLHAVNEELGLRWCGSAGEQFAERMREPVIP